MSLHGVSQQQFASELETIVNSCMERLKPFLQEQAQEIARESVEILMPVLIREELRKMVTIEFKSQLLDRMNITVTMGDEHGN